MRRTEVNCRECGSFSGKRKKLNYDEKRITKSIVDFVKLNPATISIIAGLIGMLLVLSLISYSTSLDVYVAPIEPAPTMTIGGFVSFVLEAELPVFWWAVIFLFLWLTKWN